MELKDKVIVITGGTSGFGKALANAFHKEGAQVLVCARDKKELKDFPRDGILGAKADVTREKDVEKLAEFAVKKFGRIDIWVNNAGIWLPRAPIEEVDWEGRGHDIFEVNVFGTIYGSKAALIQMRKQESGVIINIISTSGLEGRVDSASYCASKFAANGFTKSLRKETEKTNIVVLSVYPGGMKTNLFDENMPENYADYMDPSFVAGKVIKNLESDTPEEELIIRRGS